MPNHRSRPLPRRHSVSSGDESFRPRPAKADDLPRPDSRRRARLPRSKSTSNVSDALSRARCATDDTSNVALEQVDNTTLRELANVLRTTGPSPNRQATHDDCFRISGTGEPRRWSLQSLRRSKRMKFQRNSLQSHLPDNVIPGTTAEGYRYNAISTPAPKKNTADGPWFRSQYPVFLPSPQSPIEGTHRPSSPRVWPERSSSKGVHFSRGGRENGDNEFSPDRRNRSNDHSQSNRVSTDHLLRAMLNPVDEGNELDLGPSWEMLCARQDPDEDTTRTLLQMAVDEEQDHRLDDSQEIKPQLDGKGSPHLPPRSSRRVANIHIQPGLAVPKEDLLLESPGFPNMLATMTFPCPPKGSRPSSPASHGSTAPSIADSLSSRPAVQPRTSSRRAATSTSVSAASLNGIVMQKRPSSIHATSDRPTQSIEKSNTVLINGTSADRPPTAPADHPTSSATSLGEADQGLKSQFGSIRRSREERVAPSGGGVGECQRESLASQLTATTSSSRQSTSTNSSRSSTASEVSTHSKSTITAQKPHSEAIQTSKSIVTSTSEQCTNAPSKEPTSIVGKEDEIGPTETSTLDFYDRQERAERPSSGLSSTSSLNSGGDPQNKSIIERRKARKAKVREYKIRDLDASRADMIDSPVLGYFPSSLPFGRDSPYQAHSTSVHGLRRPSTLSMATTISEASNETPQKIDSSSPVELNRGPVARRELYRGAYQSTTYSGRPVDNICNWHTSGITMSPVMVVADVESRPGSPTLRSSSLARPEPSNSRVRLKPLKISPHSRQKSLSVTISRNPMTGAIERSSSAPIDPRFNRRSLMTVPTPPMSPEVTQASKQRESESSLRSATLKERVMREKLQKEKEITDIVAKTVGPPQKQEVQSDELGPLSLEQNNTEGLEKRLKRLERNNDAWLSAMKPLLEAMARTLDDMRVDERSSSLRMSDFVIDMEAEARRVSHSQRGEKEHTSPAWQTLGKLESRGNVAPSLSTPLSPVAQEPDDSSMADSGVIPVSSTDRSAPPKRGESRDCSDLDPLIRELNKPPKPRDLEGGKKSNTLSPLMRELVNASDACAEVTDLG
ncbi:hypothetical protein NPX13_g153 [Xylaria arbuscula]|uniref:Uncharacterized protein n=1 Tax=Xylaria arbuscula TaxID=114810 RepID=A0A9W8NP17_9PEZI|nr:hypothetical protein NPX13_g153 [Xylaria arbuscula]